MKASVKSSCSISGCGKKVIARDYCSAHYNRLRRHGHPLGGGSPKAPKGEPLRFVHEVALLHVGDDCLIWPFGKDGNGYGGLWVDEKNVGVSRYICELVHGAPPTPEHEAAHSCGKGHEACIAPGHLSWKTKADNEADKLIHGTHNRGERNGISKLTEADAREIIALRGKETQFNLADRFGVSHQAIGEIHRGQSWSWLEENL